LSLYELIDEESALLCSFGLGGLSISDQCRILGLSRSGYYRWKKGQTEEPKAAEAKDKEELPKRADAVLDAWQMMSFLGYRKMAAYLSNQGFEWATEKRIRLLYKQLGIEGAKPQFKSTRPSKHPYGKFPYLLRDRAIKYVNEVWATDITYIKLPGGMVYLTAVIDLYSRKILSWRLSNTMDVSFCIDCIEEAMMKYGIPAIFNCDQGSQYTSKEYITLLQSYGIRISMDGRASWRDNVLVERSWRTLKYECIFLNDWTSMPQLEAGLKDFIRIYNEERPHESLGYQTPSVVYCKGCFPLENDKDNKEQVA